MLRMGHEKLVPECREAPTVPLPNEPQDQLVEQYRQHPALSVRELWLRCFMLGAMSTEWEVETFVFGLARLSAHEHNVVAVAMNEYFVEFDPGQFVPYVEDGYSPN
jgi:hypothetical protein